MSTEKLFVEKFRPKTIDECILPKRIKVLLNEYVKAGSIPNLLFEGSPGTGKTTVARALCEMTGTDYIVVNSSEERGIDVLRNKITNFASTVSFTSAKKCIIMDEVDFLTPEAQAAFRGIIEKFSSNCTFILTCNFANKLMEAIDSRMATVSFRFLPEEKSGLQVALFKRLKQILDDEKIEYDDKVLVKILDKYYPDFRKTLGELQKFSRNGKLDADTLAQLGSVKNVDQLVQALKEKNFGGMRKWIETNSDIDAVTIYRRLYDGLYDYFDKSSIPQVVILIAKYQFQHSFVADPSINLAACLTELMVEAKFA